MATVLAPLVAPTVGAAHPSRAARPGIARRRSRRLRPRLRPRRRRLCHRVHAITVPMSFHRACHAVCVRARAHQTHACMLSVSFHRMPFHRACQSVRVSVCACTRASRMRHVRMRMERERERERGRESERERERERERGARERRETAREASTAELLLLRQDAARPGWAREA